MYDRLKKLLESDQYSVMESFMLQARPAVYAPVPQFLFESAVGQYLEDHVAHGIGLWRHQTEAIDALVKGRNVVIPTGTASGKSLIFRSVAFLFSQLRRLSPALDYAVIPSFFRWQC